MNLQNIALIYDDSVRPDTTGGYCLRALLGLIRVSHFRPDQLGAIPSEFEAEAVNAAKQGIRSGVTVQYL